jgi:hypothetical protein
MGWIAFVGKTKDIAGGDPHGATTIFKQCIMEEQYLVTKCRLVEKCDEIHETLDDIDPALFRCAFSNLSHTTNMTFDTINKRVGFLSKLKAKEKKDEENDEENDEDNDDVEIIVREESAEYAIPLLTYKSDSVEDCYTKLDDYCIENFANEFDDDSGIISGDLGLHFSPQGPNHILIVSQHGDGIHGDWDVLYNRSFKTKEEVMVVCKHVVLCILIRVWQHREFPGHEILKIDKLSSFHNELEPWEKESYRFNGNASWGDYANIKQISQTIVKQLHILSNDKSSENAESALLISKFLKSMEQIETVEGYIDLVETIARESEDALGYGYDCCSTDYQLEMFELETQTFLLETEGVNPLQDKEKCIIDLTIPSDNDESSDDDPEDNVVLSERPSSKRWKEISMEIRKLKKQNAKRLKTR